MVATVVFAAPASTSAEARYEASSRSYVMVVGDYDYFTGSASYTDGITGDNAYTDDSSIARVQGTNSRGRVCIQAVSPGTTVLHITVYNRLIGRTIVSRGVYGRLTSVSSPSDYRADETTYTIKVVQNGYSGSDSSSGSGTRSSSVASSPRNPRSVSLNKSSALIVKGKKTKLVATVSPSNARGKIKWKSSNSRVATVSKNGVVTGKRKGKAKITVTVKGKSAKVKASCTVKVVKPPKKVKLNRKSIKLNRGKSFRLKAKIKPKSAYKKLSWSTSNSGVATVSSKGKVKAVGKGSAVITAKAINGKKAKCKVKVGVPVKSVSISSKSVIKYRGDSFRLTAAVNPSDADGRKISWSSSNSKVASVSGGKVSCLKGGTAKITASVANGKSATCTVKVREIPSSVKLDKSTLNLVLGSKYTLNATVLPSDAYNKKITWSSDNTYSAKVSKGGVVTALETGSANITAETYNGKKAVCKVNVVPPTATSLSIPDEEAVAGKEETIYISRQPYGAEEEIVSATSSNPDVLEIKGTGRNSIEVMAYKAGTAVVTATLSNGVTGQCTVTAKLPKADWIDIENGDKEVHISLGESKKLSYTQSPQFADDPVEWEIDEHLRYSKEDVISVDSNGVVTGLRYGIAYVNVKIIGTNKSDSIEVCVDRPDAREINLNTQSLTLNRLENVELTYTLAPEDSVDSLTWSSDNPDVASVRMWSPVITAKSEGTAVITGKTSNGVEASCVVTVVVPKAEKLILDCETGVMRLGDTALLNYSFDPIGAQDKVSFESSDSSVVSVGSDGKLTAKSEGKAVVTARAESGASDSAEIWVKEEPVSTLRGGTGDVAYLDESGNLYMWGRNYSGQLGDGTTDVRSKPYKVMENVRQVACGDSNTSKCFTAAVTNSGDLYMWGDNSSGQFGDGTEESSLTPKKIMSGVKLVDCNYDTTAVITEDGELMFFGDSGGLTFYKDEIENIGKIKSVSLGWAYVAVVNEDNELYTWGYNGSGKLGRENNSRTNYHPTKVMDNVAKVIADYSRTIAITTDGSLYGCGDNYNKAMGVDGDDELYSFKKITSGVSDADVCGSGLTYLKNNGDLYTNVNTDTDDYDSNNKASFRKCAENCRGFDVRFYSLIVMDKLGRVSTAGAIQSDLLGDDSESSRGKLAQIYFE